MVRSGAQGQFLCRRLTWNPALIQTREQLPLRVFSFRGLPLPECIGIGGLS
jgi:hypothetical protein